MRVNDDPSHSMRARLEAQIAALTKEELIFEIDLLVESAKEEAGLSSHPARKMMVVKRGAVGGDEMDVEYGRLGRYENLKEPE